MVKHKSILYCLLFLTHCLNVSAQHRMLFEEYDGFQWYRIIEKSGIMWAQSKNGKTIIPKTRKYDAIRYHDKVNGNYFEVSRNGKNGACDLSGKEIIAPEKYESVVFCRLNGGEFYLVSMKVNGLKGACDLAGNEIVPCKYLELYYKDKNGFEYKSSTGKWIPLNIKLNKESCNKSVLVIKALEAPSDLLEEFNLYASKSRRKQIANMGYLNLMELYCRQALFANYALYGEYAVSEIDNETVEDVLPFLEAGAQRYADFQFMYACILSGSKTMINGDDERVETPKDYKYMNLQKSKLYFKKYMDNPNRVTRVPFGLDDNTIKKMIKNVFPDLIR